MEEWKAIPGYEGLYEVSNIGRVRSVERSYINSCGAERHIDQKIMKQRYFVRDKRQTAVVNLCNHKEKKVKSVARLVALAWCKGYVDGLTVNHIDGNTLNNNADNLEWISNEENIKHGHRTGLYDSIHKSCTLIDSAGNVKRFKKQADAAQFLGRGKSYIATRIYLKSNKAYSINGDVYGLI